MVPTIVWFQLFQILLFTYEFFFSKFCRHFLLFSNRTISGSCIFSIFFWQEADIRTDTRCCRSFSRSPVSSSDAWSRSCDRRRRWKECATGGGSSLFHYYPQFFIFNQIENLHHFRLVASNLNRRAANKYSVAYYLSSYHEKAIKAL